LAKITHLAWTRLTWISNLTIVAVVACIARQIPVTIQRRCWLIDTPAIASLASTTILIPIGIVPLLSRSVPSLLTFNSNQNTNHKEQQSCNWQTDEY